MKKNIAVIFGGVSPEHDISIITGMQVLSVIDEYLYNIYPIYITKFGKFELCKLTNNNFNINNRKGKKIYFENGMSNIVVLGIINKKIHIDCAVICLHGKNGEDGAISGMLNMAKIPYTCGDILSSAIGVDKVIFKDVLKSLGVNYIPYMSINFVDYQKSKKSVVNIIKSTLKMPIIIKPARLGSSIGISVCKTLKNIDNCLNDAFRYDNKVIIEQFCDNIKEYNIAIFCDNNTHISDITLSPKSDEILSFCDKYMGNGVLIKNAINSKAELDSKHKDYIIHTALAVYKHLGLKGVVRFDYILYNDNMYLNEINTVPGSLANKLFDMSFATLITKQIEYAIEDFNNQNKLINFFESDVLNSVNLTKMKK